MNKAQRQAIIARNAKTIKGKDITIKGTNWANCMYAPNPIMKSKFRKKEQAKQKAIFDIAKKVGKDGKVFFNDSL